MADKSQILDRNDIQNGKKYCEEDVIVEKIIKINKWNKSVFIRY